MVQFQMMTAWLIAGYLKLAEPARNRARGGQFGPPGSARLEPDDRGDVPGWVMVTVMTAALVVAILGVFRSRITDAISAALDSVTGAANG
jgi:hypothetical protein